MSRDTEGQIKPQVHWPRLTGLGPLMDRKKMGNDQELQQSYNTPTLKIKRDRSTVTNRKTLAKDTHREPHEQLFLKKPS